MLLIQGSDDPDGTAAQLDAVQLHVDVPAETRASMLAGVGHAPHLDAADVVVAAVAGFAHRLGDGITTRRACGEGLGLDVSL